MEAGGGGGGGGGGLQAHDDRWRLRGRGGGGGAGCNREKFGGVGRLFAVFLVLLNCLAESTFPSPSSYSNRIQPSYYYY